MEQEYKRNKDLIKTVDKSLLLRKIIGDTKDRTIINIYNILHQQIEYCALQIFSQDLSYEEKFEALKNKALELQHKCVEICQTRNTTFYNDPEKLKLMEEYFNYFFNRLIQVLTHGQINDRDEPDSHPAESISLDSELFTEEDVKSALETLALCCDDNEETILTITDENESEYIIPGPAPYLLIPSGTKATIIDFQTTTTKHLARIVFEDGVENGTKLKTIGNAKFWQGDSVWVEDSEEGRFSRYYYNHTYSYGSNEIMIEGYQEFMYWNGVWTTIWY